MATSFRLTQTQPDQLRLLTNNGTRDFWRGYQFVYDEFRAGRLPLDADTAYWFRGAAKINANDPTSLTNTFIRAFTREGLGGSGDSMQVISNSIGRQVIADLLDGRLLTITDMIQRDINVVISDFGVTIGGWGGSFYYWRYPDPRAGALAGETIGSAVLESSAETNKFTRSMAAANTEVIKHVIRDPSAAALEAEGLRSAANAAMSNLPTGLTANIAIQTAERVVREFLAGRIQIPPGTLSGQSPLLYLMERSWSELTTMYGSANLPAGFATDLSKLGGDAGAAQGAARDALVALMVEAYESGDATAASPFAALADGGLHFDVDGVAGDTGYALAVQRLEASFGEVFGVDGSSYRQYLNGEEAWHVQHGESAMNFTASASEDDVAIGGIGNDNVESGAGNDLIYGDDGNDSLGGGGGTDLVVGGAGDDTLNGGTGNDQLVGGTGFDTYNFEGNFGHDSVVDADRSGIIKYGSGSSFAALPAGLKLNANNWQSADGGWTYVFAPAPASTRGTLYILKTGSADTITVQDWGFGELGIVLTDTQITTAETTRTILGDLQPTAPLIEYDDLGNRLVTVTPAPDRADTLFDSAGNDLIQSGGGNDLVYAGVGGSDRIELGAGMDFALGGAGVDTISGEAGRDVIGGGGGADVLRGGADEDRINGNSGADVIDGGDWADLIGGGRQGPPISTTDANRHGAAANDDTYVIRRRA